MGTAGGPRVRWALGALAVVLLCGLVALGAWSLREPPRPLAADLNDAAARVAAAWPHPREADLGDLADQVLLVDAQGQVIDLGTTRQGRSGPLQVLAWSARHRPLTGAVVVDGRTVAWVLLDDRYGARVARQRQEVLLAGAAAMAGVTAVAASFIMWVRSRVLVPFRRLDRFAAQVAAGHVDAPLDMDPGGSFRAWSQSLDVLRTELAASRRREARHRASKQALLAQIGHDLRTPVATISATAELLELTEARAAAGSGDAHHRGAPRERHRQRLALIRAKTQQVDQLLTDLLDAHGQELQDLTVAPQELEGTGIESLVRQADHRDLVHLAPFPQVLVRFDPLRLSQVLDNVIHNSYKYASTSIDVRAHVDGGMLAVEVTDTGPGVDPDETDLIFARGHRGRSAAGHPGQGLGLFTSAQLMERMGGHIQASLPDAGGLRITLSLPLA